MKNREIIQILKGEHGLSSDVAAAVLGIIVEERMQADLQGYRRGFTDGHESAKRGSLSFGEWAIVKEAYEGRYID